MMTGATMLAAQLKAAEAGRDSAVYEQGELYAQIARLEAERDVLKLALEDTCNLTGYDLEKVIFYAQAKYNNLTEQRTR